MESTKNNQREAELLVKMAAERGVTVTVEQARKHANQIDKEAGTNVERWVTIAKEFYL